jgi:hypothetical protein
VLGVSLPRHHFKAVGLFRYLCRFPGLAVFVGVDARCNLFAGIVPTFSGVFQAYVRGGAKGQQFFFFLAVEKICEPLPLAPFGAGQQEQAPLIKEFALFGLGLGLLDCDVCKRHLG